MESRRPPTDGRAVKESALAARLGPRLQDLRRSSGLTQEQAAESANLAPNYISEVERGAKVPSVGTLAALAGAYGVSLSVMFLGVDRPLPKQFLSLEQTLAGLAEAEQERVLEVLRAALNLLKER